MTLKKAKSALSLKSLVWEAGGNSTEENRGRSFAFLFFPVAAGPAADHQGTSEHDEWCDDPSTIHKRLDTVQEQLEKTVEHLDSEVKSLLNDVSETAWTKPLAPGTPLVDLFEDCISDMPLLQNIDMASDGTGSLLDGLCRKLKPKTGQDEHFIGSSCFQTQRESETQDNLEQKLQSDLKAAFFFPSSRFHLWSVGQTLAASG
ncbi:hypothetical protein Chor_013710, partial [Crotalus horridus]